MRLGRAGAGDLVVATFLLAITSHCANMRTFDAAGALAEGHRHLIAGQHATPARLVGKVDHAETPSVRAAARRGLAGLGIEHEH